MRGGYGEQSPERKIKRAQRGVDSLSKRPAVFDTAAAGTIPWARRYQWDGTDQAIASGSEINVELPDYGVSTTPDGSPYFSQFDNGTQDGITIDEDGMYDLLVRLWWSNWPGDHAVIVNGIDPDAWGGYAIGMPGPGGANTLNVSGGLPGLRLAAGQDLYLSVYHEFGSSRSLEGMGGSFFELSRRGDTDMSEPRSGNSP